MKAILAVVVLFIAFIVTTVLTDTICQLNGYYDQGIHDSEEFGQ